MITKYGVYDGEELRVKMDAIRQELKQWVQLYYDKLERLFVKREILDANGPSQARNQEIICGSYLH